MKKLLSLLLCLVLLLGLASGALAAETDEPEAPETAVDAAEAHPDAPPEWEEPEEKPFWEELPVEPEDEDEIALMAGTATVSASVSFPAGTSAVGDIRIYLVKACETDKTGLVIKEPYTRSQTATVNGSAAFSVSFANVEAGDYFFGVYSSDASLTGLSSETYYLNADGTKAGGRYTATTFKVTDGSVTARSFTLLKPARSISGTLQFSSPLPEDLRLEVMSNGSGSNSYSYFTAPRGAVAVPFLVSADENASVYIDFLNTTNGGSWHRYCINGTLDGEWSELAYFTPERGTVSGLVINGDALLEGAAAVETIPVTVTVKLPEALTERRRFNVAAFYGSDTRSTSTYAQAGATQLSVRMNLRRDTVYTFGYRDVTDIGRTYNGETFGFRYGTDSGITTLPAGAKSWTFTGDSGAVTIQEPACLKITGTLDRGGFMAGYSSIGYVKAVFPEGETYTATVNFYGDAAEKSYTIFVPAAQKDKTYSLSAARAQEIDGNRPLEISWTEPVSGTLTGNVTAAKISIEGPGVTVSGTVSLPEGAEIPAGGVCARVYDGNSGLGVRYIFREGLTSAEFSFTDYTDDSDASFNANLENSVRLISRAYVYAELSDTGFTGLAFTFRRTVTVSGTVKLPEGVSDLGANVEIYGPDNSMIVTIFKGETEAAYSVQMPMGERAELSAYLRAETYPCLMEEWYYLNAEWQFVRGSSAYPTAEADRENVDLVMTKARLVTGTLAGAGGPALRLIPSAENGNRWISLGVSGTYSSSLSVKMQDDLSWSIKVPEEMAESCKIYATIRADSYVNAVQGTYYYGTGTEAVTDSSGAETLTVPETGLSGLTLRVTTGWVLEGTLTVPEGGYVKSSNSSSASIAVYARNETNSFYGYALVVPGSGPWSFAVVVPAAESAYSVSINNSLGSSWDTNIIFKAEAESMAVTGDTDSITLPLTLAKCVVSGTFTRPAGYTGYMNVSVYVDMVNGEETGETYGGSGAYLSSSTASGSYRVLIPASETMTKYRVRAQVSSDSGYLANRIWLTETGVTTKEAEAAVFTLSGDAKHDFTPVEQPSYLSGKIYIPEGITAVFSLSIRGVGNQSFQIDPSACPSDSKGKYYAYKLRSNRDYETSYNLSYSASCDTETDLYTNTTMYVLSDGTLTTNYSEATEFNYVPGSEATLDFTLAKAILLSGSFTDEAGTALRWTLGDSGYLYLYLSYDSGYSESYRLQVAEDGTWTCKLSPNRAGSYDYAYVRPDDGCFEKALADTYYYSSAGKVVTESSEASPLEITAAGLSGLEIRMNTGWLISGRLTVPEGGYYRLKEGYTSASARTMSIQAREAASGSWYYGTAQIGVGTDPWSFSVTVPKTEGTYTVSTGSFYPDSNIDTNILFNTTVQAEGVTVKGDTSVPDMQLHIAKAIITGTVSRPEGFTGYVNFRVNVITEANIYTTYCYLYNSEDAAEYAVSIPDTDESGTYTVRCNLNYAGLVSQSWVAESGMTKKEAEAKTFTFGRDSDVHNFTLMIQPPYISGKVYIPDGVDSPFSVYIQGSNSTTLRVDPAEALRDAGGRYVPYSLTTDSEEFTFTLSYRINSDESGLLLKPSSYSYFYVTEDGGFTTVSSEARSFSYAGASLTADLHLLTWNSWDDRFVFQSGHGISENKYTYTYTIPEGVTSVSFHFAFADCNVKINGANYYASSLTNSTKTFKRSDSRQVVMVIDLSSSTGKYYGFGVDAITIAGTPANPSAPSVFTESGSGYPKIISDVREGKTLNAVFLGNGAEPVTRKALAAAYDANGRFLEVKLVDVTISSAGGVTAQFDFKANENISEVRIMLLDSTDYAPEMQQITIKAG